MSDTVTYTITGPDGKDYEIDGPPGKSREEVVAAVRARNPDLGGPEKPDSIHGGGVTPSNTPFYHDLSSNFSAGAEEASKGVGNVLDGIKAGRVDQTYQGAANALGGGAGMLFSLPNALLQSGGLDHVINPVMQGVQGAIKYGVGAPLEYATSGALPADATAEIGTLVAGPKILHEGVKLGGTAASRAAALFKKQMNLQNVTNRGAEGLTGRELSVGEHLNTKSNYNPATADPNLMRDSVTLSNGTELRSTPGESSNNPGQLQQERLLLNNPEHAAWYNKLQAERHGQLNDLLRSEGNLTPDLKTADQGHVEQFAPRRVGQAEQGASAADQQAQPSERNTATQSVSARNALTEANKTSREKVSAAYEAIDPGKVWQATPEEVSAALKDAVRQSSIVNEPIPESMMSVWNDAAYKVLDPKRLEQGYVQNKAGGYMVPLRDVSELRSKFLAEARNLAQAGKINLSEGLGAANALGDSLKNLIASKAKALGAGDVAQRWSEASKLARDRAETWKEPGTISSIMKGDRKTVPDTMPNETLNRVFSAKGEALRNNAEQLMKASGGDTRVTEAIANRVLTEATDKVRSSSSSLESFLDQKQFGHLLDHPAFFDLKGKLGTLLASQKAVEVAKGGMLGALSEKGVPHGDTVVSAIMESPLADSEVRAVIDDMKSSPLAEAGLKGLVAKWVINKISSNIKNTAGEFNLAEGKTNQLIRGYGERLSSFNLGMAPVLNVISDGIEFMGRVAKSNAKIGSDTRFNLNSPIPGSKSFLETILTGRTRSGGSHATEAGGGMGSAAGFTGGMMIGGPLVGIAGGIAGGVAGRSLASHLAGGIEADLTQIAIRAAQDASYAKALRLGATKHNLSMLPKKTQALLLADPAVKAALTSATASNNNQENK